MAAVLVLLMLGLVSVAMAKPATGLALVPDSSRVEVQWCTSTVYCPSCTSCCRRPDSNYGCCGSNMVCCPDGFHCCPYGTRCDSTSSYCTLGGSSLRIPAVLQQSASLIDSPQLQVFPGNSEQRVSALEPQAPLVVWCTSRLYCADCTTCCLSPKGTWSCCIYTNGRCCSNGIHCCPYGYTCDSTSLKCILGYMSVPAARQRPALSNSSQQQQQQEEEPEVERAERAEVEEERMM